MEQTPVRFDIFTLLPEMFRGPLSESILARAQAKGLLEIALHNPRDTTTDRHHIVDDYPYGGGAGMVMKPEPLFAAVEAVYQGGPIILLYPPGRAAPIWWSTRSFRRWTAPCWGRSLPRPRTRRARSSA